MDALRAGPALMGAELNALEAEARRRLADFQGLLARHPTEARKVVESLLDGPLTFTPTRRPRSVTAAQRAEAGRR